MNKDKRVKELEEALDKLVHANEDDIDDYPAIDRACEEAKKLLPNYKPRRRDV